MGRSRRSPGPVAPASRMCRCTVDTTAQPGRLCSRGRHLPIPRVCLIREPPASAGAKALAEVSRRKKACDVSSSRRHFEQQLAPWAQHVFVGAQQSVPKQHACGGSQHSAPTAQQSTPRQHPCGGKQQSEPALQQSVRTDAAQHACGGSQQSAPWAQQSRGRGVEAGEACGAVGAVTSPQAAKASRTAGRAAKKVVRIVKLPCIQVSVEQSR